MLSKYGEKVASIYNPASTDWWLCHIDELLTVKLGPTSCLMISVQKITIETMIIEKLKRTEMEPGNVLSDKVKRKVGDASSIASQSVKKLNVLNKSVRGNGAHSSQRSNSEIKAVGLQTGFKIGAGYYCLSTLNETDLNKAITAPLLSNDLAETQDHSKGESSYEDDFGEENLTGDRLQDEEQLHLEPVEPTRMPQTAVPQASTISMEETRTNEDRCERSSEDVIADEVKGLAETQDHSQVEPSYEDDFGEENIAGDRLQDEEQLHLEPVEPSRMPQTAVPQASTIPMEETRTNEDRCARSSEDVIADEVKGLAETQDHSQGEPSYEDDFGEENITGDRPQDEEQLHLEPVEPTRTPQTAVPQASTIPMEDTRTNEHRCARYSDDVIANEVKGLAETQDHSQGEPSYGDDFGEENYREEGNIEALVAEPLQMSLNATKRASSTSTAGAIEGDKEAVPQFLDKRFGDTAAIAETLPITAMQSVTSKDVPNNEMDLPVDGVVALASSNTNKDGSVSKDTLRTIQSIVEEFYVNGLLAEAVLNFRSIMPPDSTDSR